MTNQDARGYPPAVVVGGMHRSGTSLTAALLAASGIHLGDEVLPASDSNPRGHFEDLDFYRLHQKILASNGLAPEGYIREEMIEIPPAARAEAMDLVRRRRAAGRPWGWKDPRTVLFLDFWAELVPEARWLFVIRRPEEVVDSLFRRGDPAFAFNPRLAVAVCAAYGRRMLDFVRRDPSRAAVVDLLTVVHDPASVVRRMASLLGTDLVTPESVYDAPLLTTDQPAHRATLVLAAQPEMNEIFAELGRFAGREPSAHGVPALTDAARSGLEEWAAGSRLRAERRSLEARQAELDRLLARMAAGIEAERRTAAEALARAEGLAAEAAAAMSQRDADVRRLRAELDTAVEHHQQAERQWRQQRDLALSEREQTIASLETDRDGVLTQLDAERAVHHALHAERLRREAVLLEREHAIASLEAERDGLVAQFEAERNGLVAQLEAERSLHEALRVDMTGRIETAGAGRPHELIG